MAEQVGQIYYDVTMETSGVIRAEREVTSRLQRIGDEGDKLEKRFSSISEAISAALAAIAVDKLIDTLVQTQRQFDVMFASLKTSMGGMASDAQREFARLQKFAAQTPYSLDQSVNGFVKLVNLGLDPSERAMTSFGNTASAMGKSLDQMIEAVADASTDEFERLKEFGIKAKSQGDKITFTFRGVQTTVANTAAAITEYLVKIGETNFAGAMTDRMDTLDGAISNLGDAWDALKLTISQSGIGDAIGKAVGVATTALQEAQTSLRDGRLTDYFSGLQSAMGVAEVAGASLAGVLASKLVSAVNESAQSLLLKATAGQRAAAADVEQAAAAQRVASENAAAAAQARQNALAASELAAANLSAARSEVALAAAEAERTALAAALARGTAAESAQALVAKISADRLAAARVAEAAASQTLVVTERELGVARTAALGAIAEETAATVALTAAQRAQAAASSLAGMATRGASAVIGALGGPIGIAVTAVTLLAFNWDKLGNSARTAAEISEDAAQRISKALSRSSSMPMKDLQDQLTQAQNGMAAQEAAIQLKQQKAGGIDRFGKWHAGNADVSKETEQWEAYREVVIKTKAAIDDLKQQQMKDLFPDQSPSPGVAITPKATKNTKEAQTKTDVGPAFPEEYTDALKAIDNTDTAKLTKLRIELGYLTSLKADGKNIRGLDEAIVDLEDAISDLDPAQQQLKQTQGAVDQLVSQTAVEQLKQLNLQFDELVQRYQSGALGAEAYAQAMTKLNEQMAQLQPQAKATTEQVSTFWDQAMRNIQNSTSGFLVDAMKGDFKSIETSFKSMIDNMVAQGLASKFNTWFFGSTDKNGKTTSTGAVSSIGNWLGNLLPTSGKAAIASEQSGDSLDNFLSLIGEKPANAAQGGETSTNTTTATTITATTITAGTITAGTVPQTSVAVTGADSAAAAAGAASASASGSSDSSGISAGTVASLASMVGATSSSMGSSGSTVSLISGLVGKGAGIYSSLSTLFGSSGGSSTSDSSWMSSLMSMFSSSGSSGDSSWMSSLMSLASSYFGGFRAYGGPTSSGKLYRVNERGAPELYTAANGNQYMLPTGNGSVTAADKVSSSLASGGNSTSVTNNFSISGKSSSATQQQVAARASRAISRAMARNS
jgi:hypothetical protein